MTSLMLEETLAAPDAVRTMLKANLAPIQALGGLLRSVPPASIVTIARGSSDHAAAYLAYLMTVRTGRLVTSLPMSLVTLYRAPLEAHRMLAIAVSQSGRSPDVVEPVRVLRQGGATTLALVNDEASPLADAAEWVLPLHAGEERSVAATKSFICSLAAAAALTAHWSQSDDLLQALRTLPEALEAARAQDWSAPVQALAGSERLMVVVAEKPACCLWSIPGTGPAGPSAWRTTGLVTPWRLRLPLIVRFFPSFATLVLVKVIVGKVATSKKSGLLR